MSAFICRSIEKQTRLWTSTSKYAPHFVHPRACVTVQADEGFPQKTLGPLPRKKIRRERKLTAADLRRMGERKRILEEKKQRRRALDRYDIPHFGEYLRKNNLPLNRKQTTTLQVNIGLYCNQSCNHCHVESSPERTEMMDRATAERVVEVLKSSPSVTTVDITGGAPELNSQFRFLVSECTKLNKTVIDRCNLTVLYEPGMEDLVDFLKEHKVHIVASMPCYEPKNVTLQRGSGVYERSIQALIDLNKAGFGVPHSELKLDLVYNPLGPSLPPDQAVLEKAYKQELFDRFTIQFNELFCFTNMPIKRFADDLYRRGDLADYMNLLVNNFNRDVVPGLMCRDLVSVSWCGHLFDCDFNQMMEIPLGGVYQSSATPDAGTERSSRSIFDINSLDELFGDTIATDNHCYGCTAGAGSS